MRQMYLQNWTISCTHETAIYFALCSRFLNASINITVSNWRFYLLNPNPSKFFFFFFFVYQEIGDQIISISILLGSYLNRVMYGTVRVVEFNKCKLHHIYVWKTIEIQWSVWLFFCLSVCAREISCHFTSNVRLVVLSVSWFLLPFECHHFFFLFFVNIN